MRTVTTTFRNYFGTATYRCVCEVCGKPLRRTVTVEYTVNPFNRNAAGEVKSAAEVQAEAQRAATIQAKALDGTRVTCQNCQEKSVRELLLSMAAEPGKVFPRPEPFYDSPMDVLHDRKQVERHYEACSCGAECCSGYKRSEGFRITADGKARAVKLQQKVGAPT